ncbi:flagellar hook-associated protein FlgK [Laribacter hongkongensis]|uniref:flagellar hook-associated protein FlgK n=1 Tax=Laribacter hongkongensis TaxID=168471 RepID=UPI001EFC91C7|nr:flagellar hook-associated protein FlgK [Laribacter hongkongensis]MCG9105684.1 flagellar hook-associated protein FlgK [Laribacter hongkongensis]
MSLLNIGVTGLNAARAALTTTSQNVSNVNTAGYHRKAVNQSALYYGPGQFGNTGNGVRVDDIYRVYDSYLDKAVQTATSSSKYYDTQYAYLDQLDQIISSSTTGLAPRMQDLFTSIQSLSSDPSSIPARQAMIDKAAALVNTFKSVDIRHEDLRTGINTEIRSGVTSINGLAKQIATLNDQIAKLWQGGSNPPNDLLDQRDQALTELNKYIGATSVPLDDGTINVFMGNGQSLVLGAQTFELEAIQSKADASELTVGYKGTGIELPKTLLTGGSLGGALEMRDTLNKSQQQLGAIAVSLVSSFNAQHQQGVDRNGVTGKEFFGLDFNFPEFNTAFKAAGGDPGTFDPNKLDGLTSDQLAVVNRFALRALSQKVTKPEEIAAASKYVYQADATNTGDGKVSSYSGLAGMDAKLATALGTGITVTFTNALPPLPPLPGNFTLTGADLTTPPYSVIPAPGTTGGYKVVHTSPTGQQTDAGFEFTMTGTPAAGDQFQFRQRLPTDPFTETGDNSNLTQLAKLQTAEVVDVGGGKTTLQGAYGQLATMVGSKTNEVKVMKDAQTAILKEAMVSRENVSGVNLDEEAANLLKYQQAYQASSKVVQIAGSLFDSILQAIG